MGKGQEESFDLCVIGAGPAGFAAAALAAQLGGRVAVVVRGRGGGGAAASAARLLALRAAADSVDAARRGERFGVVAAPAVDWSGVRRHIDGVAAAVGPNLSDARLTALGATVVKGEARFVARDAVAVGDRVLRARRFVVAAGSAPVAPAYSGIESGPALTEDGALTLEALPEGLIVLGGEPNGVALAQAFRRLGAKVAIVAPDGLLPADDPEAVAVLRSALRRDDVALVEGVDVRLIEHRGGRVALIAESRTERDRIEGTHLLVSAGRRPDIEGLGLDLAGVASTSSGITVDAAFRTTNPHVYAIGDCIGGVPSATLAADQASLVVRHALLRMRGRTAATPRVGATNPEIAQIGMTESEARRSRKDVTILRWPFAENDRARAERDADGFIKVLCGRGGEILGVTCVGRDAGEAIAPWALAMRKELTVRDVADAPFAYGTRSEANRRVALSALLPKLLSPVTRAVVRALARLP
ncbi:MAG: dihydrolipoyl dehydrogenase family protein [Gemmatimonas sp.]